VVTIIGECTGKLANEARALGWGRMWIARTRNIYTYPGEPWGFDNGAFRDWRAGQPFNEKVFGQCLEKAMKADSEPYLAVLPDIPAQGYASLEYSLSWLAKLPDFPWYVAVQDGMRVGDLPTDRLTGIFLGGTNSYKSTAGAWCDWAHAHGLKFHYGRAGTQNKVAHARSVGADSLDSAFPMWTMERWNLFKSWVTHGPHQVDLFFEETE
jgi:hypothetical protein